MPKPFSLQHGMVTIIPTGGDWWAWSKSIAHFHL